MRDTVMKTAIQHAMLVAILTLFITGCGGRPAVDERSIEDAVNDATGAETTLLAVHEENDTATLAYTATEPTFGMDGPNLTTNHTVVARIQDDRVASIEVDGVWDATNKRSLADITIREGEERTSIVCGNLSRQTFATYRNGTLNIMMILQDYCGNLTYRVSGDTSVYPPRMIIELQKSVQEDCPEIPCGANPFFSTRIPINETFGEVIVRYEGASYRSLAFASIACSPGSTMQCPRGYTCSGTTHDGLCVLDTPDLARAQDAYNEYIIRQDTNGTGRGR